MNELKSFLGFVAAMVGAWWLHFLAKSFLGADEIPVLLIALLAMIVIGAQQIIAGQGALRAELAKLADERSKRV